MVQAIHAKNHKKIHENTTVEENLQSEGDHGKNTTENTEQSSSAQNLIIPDNHNKRKANNPRTKEHLNRYTVQQLSKIYTYLYLILTIIDCLR